MSQKLKISLMISIGLILLFRYPVIAVLAQDPTPEDDRNCVVCHEHRYYLYDSGKWFCLCGSPMHCVYCHDGRTDSPIKEIAHEGIVRYPTAENAARCQTCHTEDTLSRLVTFGQIAGISTTPLPVITVTVEMPVAEEAESVSASFLHYLSQFPVWRLVGLGVVAILFVLVLIFGYHCWKIDCLSRKQPINHQT